MALLQHVPGKDDNYHDSSAGYIQQVDLPSQHFRMSRSQEKLVCVADSLHRISTLSASGGSPGEPSAGCLRSFPES